MLVKEKITCVFRRPRFPLICDFDGYVFAAKSLASLQGRLAGLKMPDEKKIRLCDANGESWMLLLKGMILAPGFPMNKWRKLDIIRLFNESRSARKMGIHYPEHGLGNKRLDRIVCEIGAILSGVTKADRAKNGNGTAEFSRGKGMRRDSLVKAELEKGEPSADRDRKAAFTGTPVCC